MKQILILLVAALSIAGASLVRAQKLTPPVRRILSGTIGGKYDIRMYLWLEGDTLSGEYLYETNGGGIAFDGTVGANGSFILKETDLDGNQTGVFKGKLTRTTPGSESTLHLEGTWSKPDGSGAMPFSLDDQRFDLGAGVRLTSKRINTKNKKPAYEIEARYPQIEGSTDAGIAAFNKAVSSMITSQIADFKKDVADSDDTGTTSESGLITDYEITVATRDFVSVALSASPYMAGAAHPNHYTTTLNYDLKAGKALRLADVFKPGTNYLQVLAGYCIPQLKKRLGSMSDDQMISGGASAKADNYQNWNLGKKGLQITFDPYQVAAYAAGTQRVIVRYEALKSVLNPASSVAGLVK